MAKAKKAAPKKATPKVAKKQPNPLGPSEKLNAPVMDDDMPQEPPEPGFVWRKSNAGWVQTVEIVS